MAGDRMDGFFRALVVDNKDPSKKGRVKVWIPDSMPEINPKSGKGIWAMPANNSVGGRNDEYGDQENNFAGSCMVPTKGSYVWVFFEKGNPNRPWYTGSADLQNTPALPECQIGEYQHKWVPFKSPKGRAIVFSDDPGDERVEITGKKRQMSNPPSGDIESVKNIDGNQSSIMIDERDGKEKILIRTRQGDFLCIDVEQRELTAYFENGITLKSGKDINISAEGNINIKSYGDSIISSDGKLDVGATGQMNINSTNQIKQNAPSITQNMGASLSPFPQKTFKGNRDSV